MNEQAAHKLYTNLQQKTGFTGSEEQFNALLQDEQKRQNLYRKR